MNKDDLIALSELRLKEAKILYAQGFYSGAYYLAGYSIELALKACISKVFLAGVIPDKNFVQNIYVHDLEKLLNLSGLQKKHKDERNQNPQFEIYWGVVKEWSEKYRYVIVDNVSAKDLITSIEDPQNGVLQWLKKHF